ncbi:MAG TPA: pitrilysin family protein [Candidatus Acidoferrales bacterium]|nr:pitrilysin family protein [Candidatus Acidoferrales bacterium]
MQRVIRAALIAAALLAAPPLAPARAAQPYAERVREKTLPNGLKILLLEDHKAPVAVFQIWYRVGSRNEQVGKTGLSHMLEHLMFKGTHKVGPEEYSKIIQRNGGNDNAFTADDATTYFVQLASDRLQVVVDLESDRMQNLSFDDAQFEPEHKVVMEERRLRTGNNPVASLFEQVNATAYTAHPYHWPTIGWMEDIQQLTREDALAYYRTYYAPENAFIVCAGDFSADALLAEIDKSFAPVPLGDAPPAVRGIEPVQQGERRTVLRREAQLPFVAIAYHVPNLHSADGPALEVLSAILSGGKSARLYQQLVYEKRLARDAGSSFELTSLDPGLFFVYAQPFPGKSAAQIEKELLAQVERLQQTPVAAQELTKAKNGLEAGFILAQDSLFYQALLLGQYEVAGDWRLVDTYVPSIRAVTADDLMRVAAFYLTPSNRTIGTLDPLPGPPGRPAPPPMPPQGMVH